MTEPGADDRPDEPATARDGEVAPDPRDAGDVGSAPEQELPIVDWGRTGRRMRRVALALGVLVLVSWLVIGLVSEGGFQLRLLGELVGFALLVAFVAEVVVVGGAAVVGMLRAGERGERLAGSDVSLVPPQLRRRRR